MKTKERVVFDTNVLISHLLLPPSIPSQAVGKAVAEARILISEETFLELSEVLARRKLDRYVSAEERRSFLRELYEMSEEVMVTHPVHACRDPKDDKFLELAVNGRADCIITGDSDLLVLGPFEGIRILSPAEYLAEEVEPL